MKHNKYFKKHHSRLVLEGVLRAVICGLFAGFCANFLAALAAWLFDFGGIWFAIAVGAAVGLLTGVVLYFAKFRPSVKELAQRVDRLGLEERMITMLQFQNDDSVIARLQRQNAEEHLKDVEDRKLRMRLPKALCVMAAIAIVIGSGMTTVVGLAVNEIIPSGSDIIQPDEEMVDLLAISYMVEGEGTIEGETDQLLLPGEDALPVVAKAEDGWVFTGWDDGVKTTERQDKGVTSSAVYVAIFEPIDESNGAGDESDNNGGQGGDSGQEGDQAQDVPTPENGANNADSDQGGQGEEGSGSGEDKSDQDGGKGEGDQKGEGKGDGKGQGAGGRWEETNNIIDGNTYYGDEKAMAYEIAKLIAESNGEIPPELWEFYETYFNSI